MLFLEGLSNQQRNWVNYFKPSTLQDVIARTSHMEDAIPNKASTKFILPQKTKKNNS